MNPNPVDPALHSFAELRQACAARLQALRSHPRAAQADLPAALVALAAEAFDRHLQQQCADAAAGWPAVDCERGCATCCTLRVTASAPELLLLARYLRATAAAYGRVGIDLVARLREADAHTRGLDEARRVALRRRCPFVVRGLCTVCAVRPLACRGHASLDRRACADAAAGRRPDVPVSVPHRMVRGVVQSALLAALDDAGLAWGLAELNSGLVRLLDAAAAAAQRGDAQADPDAAWRAGADPLAAVALPAAERAAWRSSVQAFAPA